MTSTQAEIDLSYSVSNDFFKLWLDKNMHYTSAVYQHEGQSLEDAQEAKANLLYDFAELDDTKTMLDIGCGWGSMVDVACRRGIRRADGITLSTEQLEWSKDRNLPNGRFILCDYALYEPKEKYDGLVSIEMIDHLCSPAQARQGLAVKLYRDYFRKLAEWVEPGAAFGFQAILSDRVPRNRKALEDLAFTADVIFPGGRNPRLEEMVQALRPYWEIEELHMRRVDYGKTTAEWLRRMVEHEDHIRATWGDVVYDDYDRYLQTCVTAFDKYWSGDVQMKLRRV
ncbi:MAG: cyclopropane-fatty-acyl-phospholipid synthase [Kiritimatiellia bacterium]|jgi:cyclopropane-fatty-acyl-phospholipid synthase